MSSITLPEHTVATSLLAVSKVAFVMVVGKVVIITLAGCSCSAKHDLVSLSPMELPPPPTDPHPTLLTLSFQDPTDPVDRKEEYVKLAEIPNSMEDTDLTSTSPGTDSGGCTIIDSKSSCVGKEAASDRLSDSSSSSSGLKNAMIEV
jgi:hypothetical protein